MRFVIRGILIDFSRAQSKKGAAEINRGRPSKKWAGEWHPALHRNQKPLTGENRGGFHLSSYQERRETHLGRKAAPGSRLGEEEQKTPAEEEEQAAKPGSGRETRPDGFGQE